MATSWVDFVALHSELDKCRLRILSAVKEPLEFVKKALANPGERGAAFELINHISVEDRKGLLFPLLDLACFANKYQHEAFLVICSLPRKWTAENIREPAKQILQRASEEEFGLLLHVLHEMRPELADQVARERVNDHDEGIRQIARAFLDR